MAPSPSKYAPFLYVPSSDTPVDAEIDSISYVCHCKNSDYLRLDYEARTITTVDIESTQRVQTYAFLRRAWKIPSGL